MIVFLLLLVYGFIAELLFLFAFSVVFDLDSFIFFDDKLFVYEMVTFGVLDVI
jgi:hypothetical protein